MAEVTVVIHPHAFDSAFKSVNGMVGDYISEVTTSVYVACKFEAPGPGKIPRNRTGINYGKGRLMNSVSKDVDGLIGDVQGTVTAHAPYIHYVMHGTAPHIIKPKRPGGMLRFFWFRKARWAVFPKVHHPGTMANPFMERGFKKGLLVHGIS